MASLITPSPCIGLCRLDQASQLCTGCVRTGAEIATWKETSSANRARTWAELPARRARLGIGLHRLGWTPDQILDFVEQSLHHNSTPWMVGIDDGSTRLAITPGSVERHGATITALLETGTIQFLIHDRVRVLALPQAGREERILLAVPRNQSSPVPHFYLTKSDDRDGVGLGSESASVYARSSARKLTAERDHRIGQTRGRVPSDLGDHQTQTSMGWMICNPVAQIEFAGSYEPLGCGPETVARMDVPESFVPCVTFDRGE